MCEMMAGEIIYNATYFLFSILGCDKTAMEGNMHSHFLVFEMSWHAEIPYLKLLRVTHLL